MLPDRENFSTLFNRKYYSFISFFIYISLLNVSTNCSVIGTNLQLHYIASCRELKPVTATIHRRNSIFRFPSSSHTRIISFYPFSFCFLKSFVFYPSIWIDEKQELFVYSRWIMLMNDFNFWGEMKKNEMEHKYPKTYLVEFWFRFNLLKTESSETSKNTSLFLAVQSKPESA